MRISDWIRRVLFRSGVTRVINLCPPDEPCAYDEEGLMAELGLDYLNIPVAGGADLSEDNARKLAIALEDIDGTALAPCASSHRVGSLFAVKAAKLDHKSVGDRKSPRLNSSP